MNRSVVMDPQACERQENAISMIRVWLIGLALLVFAMVIVGGATRLTDSGLSITEWKPIIGIVPPLGQQDWQDAFQKYQQIPEYQKINKGMSLDDFKYIFWWEWGHRFLGRIIGFVFLIPYLFFWLTGRIERSLQPKLLTMFVLGGAQGALGWYMVMSGLVDRVDVSQYRLAAHLGLAVLIFGYILWVILSLGRMGEQSVQKEIGTGFLPSAGVLLLLIYIQILLGAFVAGLDAGLSHNTWPLMDGQVIPDGLFVLIPWYTNIFENVMTVQFNHRILAYVILIWAVIHAITIFWRQRWSPIAVSASVLAIFIFIQAALGIWTLLASVPINLGLAHQAGALVVFALALFHFHRCFYGVYSLSQSADYAGG